MSHLIPTPRTNKNGVTSIRHMKPQDQKQLRALPVAPPGARPASRDRDREDIPLWDEGLGMIARWKENRKRAKIGEELVRLLKVEAPVEAPLLNTYVSSDVVAEALNVVSTDHLEKAKSLAQIASSSGASDNDRRSDRIAILHAMRSARTNKNASGRINLLHSHIDWLRDNPGKSSEMSKMIDYLIASDIIDPQKNEHVPNFESFLEAVDHPLFKNFEIRDKWRKDYLRAVSKYPNDVDTIANFIVDRQGFDAGAFELYKAVDSPLAEGAL